MASIRLIGAHHTVHHAGAILECTDSVSAAAANLALVTLDRAHALVAGDHAEWVEHPEAPQEPEELPLNDPAPNAPAAAAAVPDSEPISGDAPAAEAPVEEIVADSAQADPTAQA